HASENREQTEVTWKQLYEDTVAVQQTLKQIGITKGDRLVAYMPNIYETIVAFLATASLGAIWSSASPDFRTHSAIDRFQQIEPQVLVAVDVYEYGGKPFDRMPVVGNLQANLPSLEATIAGPYINKQESFNNLKKVMRCQ